jgi:Skp family chaperone for outer membrane proteins
MKTIVFRGLAVAGLLLALNAGLAGRSSAQAPAQKMTPTIVAVIDSQRITRDAAAFKNARQQIEQYRSRYQAEIAKEEEKLRAEEQELGRQRAGLAIEAFDAKRRDFERRVTDVQRKVQDRSRQLDDLFKGVRQDVGKMLVTIVTEMASERGFHIALDRAQVTYRADGTDITDEVLKRLDKRMPTVSVTLPPGQ